MSGPPKMPTALRVLHGETRPSQLNQREPRLPAQEPEPPLTLSAGARPYWDYTLAALRPARVLTQADRDVVADYAEHQLSHDEMVALLRQTGYTQIGMTGGSVKSPLVAMIRGEAMLCHALRGQLGLTPSARVSLKTAPEEPSGLESLLS